MPSAASPNVRLRYCFGMAKIALAANDARTAGSDVRRKKIVFSLLSEIFGASNCEVFLASKRRRTSNAETVIPTMAIFKSSVAQNTTTNAANVDTPCKMKDLPM